MFIRFTKLCKILITFLMCQMMLGGSLNAANSCMPLITAEIVCDDATGLYVIKYTATAWEGTGDPASRENASIGVYVNSVQVDSGAFQAPDYSFSNTLPLPEGAGAGDNLSIQVRALTHWGDGTYGGQTSGIYVMVPSGDCQVQATGRFTGGGHQVRVDAVRVTRGLTLHCDLLLSNNLEINWNGNQFHIDEHLTTVSCSDDPDITQAPPEAPIDTMIGIASGHYNGVSGYTAEFSLVDGGEPGDFDMASFHIYETANPANVVLDVPLQYLSGGNLQAHYDQPHK